MPYSTLKRMTSSIVACLPAPTHVWKKDGATDTPKASELIPLLGITLLADDERETARKVPKSNTRSCCVHRGNSPIILRDPIEKKEQLKIHINLCMSAKSGRCNRGANLAKRYIC